MHNPNIIQPHHTVNSSKKKDTADNQQSCQPIATSCKDRSPTPHPHQHENTACGGMNRGRENTRQSHQPTGTSCRNRSPTPHPHEHGNTCGRTFSKASTNHYKWTPIHYKLIPYKYIKTPHTVQKLHHHRTASGAFQDHIPMVMQNHPTFPYPPKVCYKKIPKTIRISHNMPQRSLPHTNSPMQKETHHQSHQGGQCLQPSSMQPSRTTI